MDRYRTNHKSETGGVLTIKKTGYLIQVVGLFGYSTLLLLY
ncbi:hypothetical protein SAMN04488137_1560 [Fictibacillus solisalsi]|uniref:Uncharacterized protein n=1 Tax=Fictibacillus solisalsi TaxID=459525 RepID=A0A1G9VFZ7_9BACL|nr:hypothetical protein SAMN04488137_1560 [Fictibacillus solisalsi]